MWGAQEKAALLAEVDTEGGKVRLVARRHGISESLLYNWRSARKAAAVAAGAADDVKFVPVGVVAGKAPHRPVLLASPEPVSTPEPPPAEGKGGSIEITLPNGARVSVDAFVNERALSRVLRAMKRLA
jgi:transposase